MWEACRVPDLLKVFTSLTQWFVQSEEAQRCHSDAVGCGWMSGRVATMSLPEVDDSQTQTVCLVSILCHRCILSLGEVLNRSESLAWPRGILKPPLSHLFLFLPGTSCFHLRFHYLLIFRALAVNASAVASIFSVCRPQT